MHVRFLLKKYDPLNTLMEQVAGVLETDLTVNSLTKQNKSNLAASINK